MSNRDRVASQAGFTSDDDGEAFMKLIFEFLELPYAETFACCSVDMENKPKKVSPFANRPGVQTRWVPSHNYGPNAFALNDAAIRRVRLVCAGDFQNVACQIITDILGGKPPQEVKASALNLFRVIPEDAPLDDVKAILRWADENRDSRPYAEARLFEPVRGGDGSWA